MKQIKITKNKSMRLCFTIEKVAIGPTIHTDAYTRIEYQSCCGNVDGSLWKLKIGCIFSPVNIKLKIYKITVLILPNS